MLNKIYIHYITTLFVLESFIISCWLLKGKKIGIGIGIGQFALKKSVSESATKNHDRCITKLKATVKETWASIPPQQCHKLITSMPRRIEAVIIANGAPTTRLIIICKKITKTFIFSSSILPLCVHTQYNPLHIPLIPPVYTNIY